MVTWTWNLNISLNCNQSGILRQRTRDDELKKYCVTLLEKFGSLSYTRRTLEELDGEARAEVAKHGGNPVLEDVLNELLEWKRWTYENKPAQWGSFYATIMSVVFMCGWWLIHICYWHITRYLKTWQKIVGNVWSRSMQHGHFLCFNLHAVFFIICYSVYVK